MKFHEVAGAGMLAGIGFTMSLFVTALSFEHAPHLVGDTKIGILIASLISAMAAYILISVMYLEHRKTSTLQ